MAVSSYDSVFELSPQQYNVGPGATLALYFPQASSASATTIKYITGGSMLLYGTQVGVTLSAAQLVAKFATLSFYMMGSGEVRSIEGNPPLYIGAQGATVTFVYELGKTQGAI